MRRIRFYEAFLGSVAVAVAVAVAIAVAVVFVVAVAVAVAAVDALEALQLTVTANHALPLQKPGAVAFATMLADDIREGDKLRSLSNNVLVSQIMFL